MLWASVLRSGTWGSFYIPPPFTLKFNFDLISLKGGSQSVAQGLRKVTNLPRTSLVLALKTPRSWESHWILGKPRCWSLYGTSRTRVTWKLVRNANDQTPAQDLLFRNSRDGGQHSVLLQALHVSLMQLKFNKPLPYETHKTRDAVAPRDSRQCSVRPAQWQVLS